MNLEIDPASCIDRFITIYGKLGFSPPHSDNIVIWNLRGHALPLDRLVPHTGQAHEGRAVRRRDHRPDLQGHHRR